MLLFKYIFYFSIFIKIFATFIGNVYRAAVSHLRFHRYNLWCVEATNTTNSILSKSEATYRLLQTLIVYEPINLDCEPKTRNHCLGPKIHR